MQHRHRRSFMDVRSRVTHSPTARHSKKHEGSPSARTIAVTVGGVDGRRAVVNGQLLRNLGRFGRLVPGQISGTKLEGLDLDRRPRSEFTLPFGLAGKCQSCA